MPRPRASLPCPTPRCPNLQPCPHHPRGPWADSPAQHAGLTGWAKQQRNARIIDEHAGICAICKRPGADLVDHIVPRAEGGTDDDSNLQPVHTTPCHQAKTEQEKLRGRMR